MFILAYIFIGFLYASVLYILSWKAPKLLTICFAVFGDEDFNESIKHDQDLTSAFIACGILWPFVIFFQAFLTIVGAFALFTRKFFRFLDKKLGGTNE